MPLSDTAIRNAKPGARPFKLSDEKGLYLLVTPRGGKWWRFDYRFLGKRKTLSMGTYPDVTLKTARSRRDEARKLQAKGIDPSKHRKQQKSAQMERAANSFEVVGREWFAKKSPSWALSHADKIIRRLENDVFPWIGPRPIAEIKPPELLVLIRRIENRGALDTAHRAYQNIGQIFRYGVASGLCESGPSRDLRDALAGVEHEHFTAITDPSAVGELLRAIDGFRGTFIVQCSTSG